MDSLERLSSMGQFRVNPGLSRIRWLMEALGSPQMSIPSIHVAGTNGKGSTCAMVDSIMNSFEIDRGLYTSPHLIEVTERMKFNGHEVSRDELKASLELIFDLIDSRFPGEERPTYFEVLTAAFFHISRSRSSDLNIVEVGMGGRFDATNVLQPTACAVTSISLDHMEYLGDEEYSIALEKGGIIKPSTPVVIGPVHQGGEQSIRALRGLLDICTHNGCPTVILSSKEEVQLVLDLMRSSGVPDGRVLVLEGRVEVDRTNAAISSVPLIENGPYQDTFHLVDSVIEGDFSTSLMGNHQLFNMGMALCLSLLSLPAAWSHRRLRGGDMKAFEGLIGGSPGELLKEIPASRIADLARIGLAKAHLPGRMERFTHDGVEMIFDGGHNPEAARTLAHTIKRIYPGKKAPMLFTMKSDKDPLSYLFNVRDIVSSLVITELKEGGMPLEQLSRAISLIGGEGFDVHARPDIGSALDLWWDLTEKSTLGLAGGSFYLYKPFKEWLRKPR